MDSLSKPNLDHAAHQYVLRGYRWFPRHYNEYGAMIDSPYLCAPKDWKRPYYKDLWGINFAMGDEIKITEEHLPAEVVHYAEVYAKRSLTTKEKKALEKVA